MDKKQQLDVIRENYLSPIALLKKSLQIWMVLFAALVVALLISLCVNIYLVMKKPLVVKVDQRGVPDLMEIMQDKSLSDLVDYQIFLTTFLNRLYSWNGENYLVQIKRGLVLMAPPLQAKYLKQIKAQGIEMKQKGQKNYYSEIMVQKIDTRLRKYQNGYLIDVFATVKNSEINAQKMKFTIGIRKSKPTNNNFWGLEVVDIEANQVKPATEKNKE